MSRNSLDDASSGHAPVFYNGSSQTADESSEIGSEASSDAWFPSSEHHSRCDSTNTTQTSLSEPDQSKTEKSIAENPFDNAASRILFDAIDKFQSCGAGEHIDIPQLVIVGGQSVGKSSLLRTLTEIPFPVGADCCTRFATRIISRRTPPGSLDHVKITVVPPDFVIEHFDYPANTPYKDYIKIKETLSASEFIDIVEEVSTVCMEINPGEGRGKKNFAIEVLKVEISGPHRSHFSILDIPGIFSYGYKVTDSELAGVQSIAVEYINSQRTLCVADATCDLAKQGIFTLTNQHVDRSRLIRVFTKCDRTMNKESVVSIARGGGRDFGQALHHGWFVVRNRNKEDESNVAYDQQAVEDKFFDQQPWAQIPRAQRGSSMLKKYLGKLFCDKIQVALPHLLEKISELRRVAEASRDMLGAPRDDPFQRRMYLTTIAQNYQRTVQEALKEPWNIEEANLRARILVRKANDSFETRMKSLGHVYRFEGRSLDTNDFVIQLADLLNIDHPEDPGSGNANKGSISTTPAEQQPGEGESSVMGSEEFFEKIRQEVSICRSTVLPGMVHPDVIARLYKEQTKKWQGLAEEHLLYVSNVISAVAESILSKVCSREGGAAVLHGELLFFLQQSHRETMDKTMQALSKYCEGDRSKLLLITNPAFEDKLQLLRSLRTIKSLKAALELCETEKEDFHAGRKKLQLEKLGKALTRECHHSSLSNTVNEVHDIVNVYYEFSLRNFIDHITKITIEDFLTDPEGPLCGFSASSIKSLGEEEVNRLGGETRDVIEARHQLDARIETLWAVEQTGREAMFRSLVIEVRGASTQQSFCRALELSMWLRSMVKQLAAALLLVHTALAVDERNGLFSSYVSLSIELIGFPQWAGTKTHRNEYSNNLINNLVQAQGSPLVVRVGGNSADRAIFDSTLTTPTAGSCKNADPGAYQCIGPSFFDSYGAFPTGTQYSHNFNLATWNSSGFATLQSTVSLACKALRGRLSYFEIGNEPDLYIGSRRAKDYSVEQYLADWFNATERFETHLQAACPDLAHHVKYMFPSVSSPGSRLRVPEMFDVAGTKMKRVTQVSVHNYMGGATQPGVTLQSTLMNHTAVANSIGGHVAYAKSVDTAADYVIGEHNSLYGGGAAGLSDVFGAALWGLDFSLYAASTGIIKRVHFHQSIASPYAAWSPVEPLQTKPPYYGKLAASTFLANSDSIEVKTIALGGDQDYDSGYGAYQHGRLQRVALLNLREFDVGSSSPRGLQKYKLQVPARSRWIVKRLTAAGARDKSGITFDGKAYEAESLGRPVHVADRESSKTKRADSRGNLLISVADSEAVILVKI